MTANAHLVLVGGYDTTANALTFALYLLAKHQQIQDQLREHILTDGLNSKYLSMVSK